MANPIKFFSVDSSDLKTMSFKLCNDIFIAFRIPGSSYKSSIGKITISLLFCPFASDTWDFRFHQKQISWQVKKTLQFFLNQIIKLENHEEWSLVSYFSGGQINVLILLTMTSLNHLKRTFKYDKLFKNLILSTGCLRVNWQK